MKKLIPIILVILLLIQIVPSFATEYVAPNIQLYFEPHIMNDITGEIIVDVKIRNTQTVLSKYKNEICALTFSFDYEEEVFDLVLDDNNLPEFTVGDDKLIHKKSDAETSIKNGIVTFTFMDSTLANNLFSSDGTLASFRLYAKDIDGLWNSFDSYPLKFIPGSVGIVAYHTPSSSVVPISSYEAIDTMVGGYNKVESFNPIYLDKHITFTADNAKIDVNGEVREIDATPYINNEGIMMVPVRYLTEEATLGMKVSWDGEKMQAISQGNRKTLTIELASNSVYVNAIKVKPETKPVETDGRIYVPASVVKDLYPGTEITQNGNAIEIIVP